VFHLLSLHLGVNADAGVTVSSISPCCAVLNQHSFLSVRLLSLSSQFNCSDTTTLSISYSSFLGIQLDLQA
jgi:hypothetical protein